MKALPKLHITASKAYKGNPDMTFDGFFQRKLHLIMVQCEYKTKLEYRFFKLYFIDYAITVVPIFPLCPSPPSTPTPSGNPHTIVHYLTLFEELTPCM